MTKWVLTLMASTALIPAMANAQAADDAGPDAGIGNSTDIIVTAQRFRQRLQDVPLSVSVMGAEELKSRSVTDLKDMQYAVPGLSIYELGVGRQQIQLRGISTSIGSSTVGIYFDETPLALDSQGDAFAVRLMNLERVEVLRGPQATLYGQASMGGTIRYIPAAPRLDAVSASLDSEYSTTRGGADNYKAVGVFNLPLVTDQLGLRIAAGYERIGGYIDGAATGRANINSANVYTVRGTLLAARTDRASLSITGLYQKSDQANQDFGVGYRTASQLPSPVRDRYVLVQAKGNYDLDFAELSGSVSYVDRRNVAQYDVSSLFVPLLVGVFGFPASFVDQVGIASTTDYALFNSELRLASQDGGPFSWQVGATYRELKVHQYGSDFTAPGTLPFAIAASDDHARSRSHALYGEVAYAFSPRLKATVGLRYFNDHRERDLVSSSFGVTTTDIGDATFDSFNPRFNLSYAFTPESMAFINVSKGFRSGGFNQTSAGGGVFPVPASYRPDAIWTYEAGTRHQLFGNRLTLDASVYRSEWSRVQSNNFAPGSLIVIINNSGHVQGWGVDLAATARPLPDLTITGTFGWNNLKFDEATADKAVGDPVDAAIRQSWSAALDYRPALTDGITGIFRIDYQHAGKGQFTYRNLATQIVERPARDLVNLRVGAAFGAVEVALFANNLFDENAPSIIGPFTVISENVEQRPRFIGISASTRF